MRTTLRVSLFGAVMGALVLSACVPPSTPPPLNGSFTLVHPMDEYVSIGRGTRAMSAGGRHVVLRVSDNAQNNIRLWDRETGDVVHVTLPGGTPAFPMISGDGSVVLFTQGSGPVAPGVVATGDEFFLYSTATGSLERIEVPEDNSRISINAVSISHDGSTVLLGNGAHIELWTRDGGFDHLLDDTELTGRVEAASLSPNARFVTLRRITPVAPDSTRIRSDYVVYDRELGAVHATSEGPTWTPDIFNPTGFNFELVATTDDGSAIYSYSDTSGVHVLDGATGTTSVLAGGVSATAASRDGRFVSDMSPAQYFPPVAPVHRMRDRVTGEVVRVGWAATPNAGIWAIADGGRELLLHSWEVGVVPESGYYLWDRDD